MSGSEGPAGIYMRLAGACTAADSVAAALNRVVYFVFGFFMAKYLTRCQIIQPSEALCIYTEGVKRCNVS